MSICSAPELSIRSGGVPPLKRGWSSDWIFWVGVNFTFASGNAFSYPLTASVAYSVPNPPSNRTKSRGALAFTPSGFFSVALPFSTFLSLPLSLLAHEARKLIVGTVIRPIAADRLITSRRPRPSLF